MTNIIFEIDNNKDECELFCWARRSAAGKNYCMLFEQHLDGSKRCSGCLDAEVEEAKKGQCWRKLRRDEEFTERVDDGGNPL